MGPVAYLQLSLSQVFMFIQNHQRLWNGTCEGVLKRERSSRIEKGSSGFHLKPVAGHKRLPFVDDPRDIAMSIGQKGFADDSEDFAPSIVF